MRWLIQIVVVVCLLASPSASYRLRREAEGKGKQSKKDLELAETRVPLTPYGYGGLEPGLGVGVDPAFGAYGGPGIGYLGHGAIGNPGIGHLGHGAIGNPGLLAQPYGLGGIHGLGGNVGYSGGYLKGGIQNAALGNHGGEYFRGGNDGVYADGGFHEGGRLSNGGFQGLEGYRDDKHHIADDHANKAYYNDVRGSRKDLGNGQEFDKSQGYAQNGFNTAGDSELGGHKKGHHRTGFKKSYHKDESGNDESFYDVDHDEGNHQIGKQFGDIYGNNVNTRLNGGHKINEYDANNLGREGYEGNGKLVALNQGLKDYYGKNGFYSNGNKYGSLGHGQSAGYGNYGVGQGFQDGFSNGRNFGYDKLGRNSYNSPYGLV